MLSVAIKNTILLVLITLIIHYMLLNYLFEKGLNYQKKGTEKFSEGGTIAKTAMAAPSAPACVLQKEKTAAQLNEELLYKYVSGNTFCAKDKTTSVVAQQKVVHEPKLQSLQGAMLIGEYDDESTLNGANVFDGISPFDLQAPNYQDFAVIDENND
jgi:hypothetical protein